MENGKTHCEGQDKFQSPVSYTLDDIWCKTFDIRVLILILTLGIKGNPKPKYNHYTILNPNFCPNYIDIGHKPNCPQSYRPQRRSNSATDKVHIDVDGTRYRPQKVTKTLTLTLLVLICGRYWHCVWLIWRMQHATANVICGWCGLWPISSFPLLSYP